MSQRTTRGIFTLVAIALISATMALPQSPTSTVTPAMPANSPRLAPSVGSSKGDMLLILSKNSSHTWLDAQWIGASNHKLVVVTFDQPHRRQSCHVKSFTVDKLVCSRAVGGPRTYLPQQVLALIIPGDENLRLPLLLGFNGGLAAAIWGTVVLTATCPACAAATAFAAFFFFAAAGAELIGDGQPDRLLYLAPGQQLTGKLRSVQP